MPLSDNILDDLGDDNDHDKTGKACDSSQQ